MPKQLNLAATDFLMIEQRIRRTTTESSVAHHSIPPLNSDYAS
jgi:hypothetical protein